MVALDHAHEEAEHYDQHAAGEAFVLRVDELGSGEMRKDEDFSHFNKTEYDD